MGAGEARGIDAGRAAEGVYFQAGVIGEEQAGGVRAVMAGFDNSVLLKGGAVFDAGRELFVIGEQLDRRHSGSAGHSKFAELSRVARGAEEVDQIPAAFF